MVRTLTVLNWLKKYEKQMQLINQHKERDKILSHIN